jgi:hypothetical protein
VPVLQFFKCCGAIDAVTDYGVVFDNDNAIAGAGRNTDPRIRPADEVPAYFIGIGGRTPMPTVSAGWSRGFGDRRCSRSSPRPH